MKCCFRTSGFGFPLELNASLINSLWLGGKGTPGKHEDHIILLILKDYSTTECRVLVTTELIVFITIKNRTLYHQL